MPFQPDAHFNYDFERRSSLRRRWRHAWRRHTENLGRATLLVVATSVLGIVLLHGFLWYREVIAEGLNRALDAQYQRGGIEPTRDAREKAELQRRMSEYVNRRKAGQQP